MKSEGIKILTILRHAKSSWDFPDLTDHERPLIEKGIHRTEKTCRFLKDKQLIPDAVFCSTAVRAIETAKWVIKNLELGYHPKEVASFYPGEPVDYIKYLKKVDPNLNHVMVIGHNPGLSNFACELLSNTVAEWIPTSGCAVIQLQIQKWDEISVGKGRLMYYIEPKKL